MVGIQILDCVLLFQDYDMLYTNKSLWMHIMFYLIYFYQLIKMMS